VSWWDKVGVALHAVVIGGGLFILVFKRVPPPAWAWTFNLWLGKTSARLRPLGGFYVLSGAAFLVLNYGRFVLGEDVTTQAWVAFVALLAGSFVLLRQSTQPPTDASNQAAGPDDRPS